MNPLLQMTQAEILERQALSANAFPDNYILAAIEAYDIEGSAKRRAQGFVTALAPLWKIYKKESYVPLFKKFIDMEIGLEAFSPEHSSHVNHVIQEFLFGYNILMNCEHLKTEYNFEEGRNDPDSQFGEFFFSWMAASLLHDVGYDIERAPEEEAFRDDKNTFWDFMTRRATTTDPLTFSVSEPGRRMIEDYILTDIENVPGAPTFSYVEFENLFLRHVTNRNGWVRYDHGVISAVKYLVELKKLQNDRGGNYLNWPPNRHAALAMALHNFRYKDCNLRLSSTDPNTVIAYLLIVSDEIQEWERERIDVDAELPEETVSGGNAKKATDLVGAIFRNKRAFVILNHRLKDLSLKAKFEEYLDEKIVLQKKHYPIRVQFPQLGKKLRDEMIKATVSASIPAVASTIPDGILTSLLEIGPDTIDKIEVPSERLIRLRKIAETEVVKNLLVPAEPNLIYEVYVDHRIEGEPYLTVVFQF